MVRSNLIFNWTKLELIIRSKAIYNYITSKDSFQESMKYLTKLNMRGDKEAQFSITRYYYRSEINWMKIDLIIIFILPLNGLN